MSAHVYLIRHAQATWNSERRYIGSSDPPLSDEGRQQAERVASALRLVPLRIIYTSPLARAGQTAAIIAAHHRAGVEVVPDLREYAAGVWEGLSLQEIEEQFADLQARWYADPSVVRIPGGETLVEMRDRVMPAFERIVRRHRDEAVAIIAHGGVNRAIILTMLGTPLSAFWRIKQDNAGINLLEFDDRDRGRLVTMNETAHLKLHRVAPTNVQLK